MMHGLSAQEIISIWEVAQHQHPVDQALTILSFVLPDMPRDEQLTLSIGLRDGYLLTARQLTFGSHLIGFVICERCQERLEFACDVADIRVQRSANNPARTRQVYELAIDGYALHFRLPNSLDLAQIASYRDIDLARRTLAQRCILQISREDSIDTVDALPESVVTALAGQMAHYDQQSEVQLELDCPACAQHWSILFDIVPFFWAEICAQAKRLLREVHLLASAYGWHEAEILGLSNSRRQFYLEMVT